MLLINIKNWKLDIRTIEDKLYMPALFNFILKIFIDIFGENALDTEECILYNDPTASSPMLITSTTPIKIQTTAIDLNHWCQFIYNLSHEMTHYILRKHKTDKVVYIKWFEETLCEAMSLYTLNISSKLWNECLLYQINPFYSESLEAYWKDEYKKTGDSLLKKCRTLEDLKLVEENCNDNRIGRSVERNYLFDKFLQIPESIADFIYYPLYIRGIQIDFEAWESERMSSQLVPHLKSIQPVLTA